MQAKGLGGAVAELDITILRLNSLPRHGVSFRMHAILIPWPVGRRRGARGVFAAVQVTPEGSSAISLALGAFPSDIVTGSYFAGDPTPTPTPDRTGPPTPGPPLLLGPSSLQIPAIPPYQHCTPAPKTKPPKIPLYHYRTPCPRQQPVATSHRWGFSSFALTLPGSASPPPPWRPGPVELELAIPMHG